VARHETLKINATARTMQNDIDQRLSVRWPVCVLWCRFCPLTSTGAVADPPPTASAHRCAVPHSAQAQLEGPLAVVPLGCARSRTNAQRTRAKADDVGVLVCAAIGCAVP
jgi:hypothetical protein